MAKLKIQDSVWNILYEGMKMYFLNIGKFTKYMLFPVFGQIVGILLIFGLTGWFSAGLPIWAQNWHFLNNFNTVIFIIVFLAIPGFIIFFKAFWDYLVAYGAINSMTEALVSNGKLYDMKAHTEVITSQSVKFIELLIVISILFIVGINPLFWIIGMIFFVYFILVFQVFTYEKDLSVYEIFKRSLFLVKGNFARTLAIMLILYIITYHILSFGANILLEIIRLSDVLTGVFETWALNLPLNEVNSFIVSFRLPAITALEVAKTILSSSVLFVVVGLTLPVRSVVWSLWYKNLSSLKKERAKK